MVNDGGDLVANKNQHMKTIVLLSLVTISIAGAGAGYFFSDTSPTPSSSSDNSDYSSFKNLTQNPEFQQALFNYGVFLSSVKKDYSTAIRVWQTALDKEPNGPNADRLKQLIPEAAPNLFLGTDPMLSDILIATSFKFLGSISFICMD